VTFVNGTIFIWGDLCADNIRIEDGGGAGQVTVFVGGAQVLQRLRQRGAGSTSTCAGARTSSSITSPDR
jgi:hypothetical protein